MLVISLIFLINKISSVIKNGELTSVLNTHLQGKIILARLTLILHFVSDLCKVYRVIFEKFANTFYT
jgi:hypothetical protein